MRTLVIAAAVGVAVGLVNVAALFAQDKPAAVVGWRGDATGCYPQAAPPLEWGRTAKNIVGVTAQAKKPGEAAGGQAITDGVIREWLVLGPTAVPAGVKVAAEYLPGEAKFAPDAGEKVGDLAWKLVKAESSYLDFNAILGKSKDSAAYAHAYIHSASGLPLVLREMRHGKIACWLNGAPAFSGDAPWSSQSELKLKKGWNSLLVKVAADGEGWYTSLALYGGPLSEYESKNIAWACKTPNKGVASPIIVGDKILVTSEPYDLCCINKADGKILWVLGTNYFDTLGDEERKKLPEVAPLAERLAAINAMWGTAAPPDGKLIAEKRQLEKQINEAMKKFDKSKYTMVQGQDAGYAGMTPVSDGKSVWVWFATGVSARYDLAGKRQWTFLANGTIPEHGFASSPTLAGDRFVVHMAETVALDAKTGEVAWRLPENNFCGSLQAVNVGGEAVVLDPDLEIIRAKDGKVLYRPPGWQRHGGCGQISTPVVKDGLVYVLRGPTVDVYKLPATAAEPFKLETVKSIKLGTADFPKFFGEWYTSSPVVDGGLLYFANNDGTLSVVDTAAGKVLYQRMLDVDVCYNHNMASARGLGASLAVAGKRLYIFGNQGAAAVLEPGPTFKQLAKNRIENTIDPKEWWWHQESSVASPIFDADRLYYRAEDTLYCIGGGK